MVKYIILDFGKVLAGPTTGDWHITPKFLELINIQNINKEKFKESYMKNKYMLSEKIVNLEQEYNMFVRFYHNILKECDYPNYNKEIAEIIAHDRAYKNTKYKAYPNIKDELINLRKKYTLLLLSDNWPSVFDAMKEYDIYNLFEKIYVSSIYGQEKKDGLFFDNPINDFCIKQGEAIFIDDNEDLLDVAVTKGLDVRLMDRENIVKNSKYQIINDLKNL